MRRSVLFMEGISLVLAISLLSTPGSLFAIDEDDAEKLERIEKKVGEFVRRNQKQLESIEKSLSRQIDGRINQIKKSDLPADVQRAQIRQILADKNRLELTHQLPTCDELLDIVIPHADRSQKLLEEIERCKEAIAKEAIDNIGNNQIEQRLLDLEESVERLLGIKGKICAGDKWFGSRQHGNAASHLELRVHEAEGDFFEASLHQTYRNGVTDIMKITGQRKGHLLLMRTNGMQRGKERELEFQGYLIGDRIITTVEGITPDGKQATGWISLSKGG